MTFIIIPSFKKVYIVKKMKGVSQIKSLRILKQFSKVSLTSTELTLIETKIFGLRVRRKSNF